MSGVPRYEDLLTVIQAKKSKLPFYISIHSIRKTTPHHHDFVELNYVLEGSGIESINGVKHQLRPGTSSFLLPHHIHELQSDSDRPVVKYCCMFDINMLLGSPYESELSSLLFRIGSHLPSYVDFAPPGDARMRGVLELLHEEYVRLDGIGRNSFIRVKLTEAMLLFVRAAQAGDDTHALAAEPAGDKINFWSMLQYIHVHYADKLTLEWLAAHFRVSTTHISRLFKKHLGRSFLDYLHNLRVESAASLLISTDMPLADIAAEAGFESYRSFSRVFRDMRGQTPSDYRHAHQPAEEM